MYTLSWPNREGCNGSKIVIETQLPAINTAEKACGNSLLIDPDPTHNHGLDGSLRTQQMPNEAIAYDHRAMHLSRKVAKRHGRDSWLMPLRSMIVVTWKCCVTRRTRAVLLFLTMTQSTCTLLTIVFTIFSPIVLWRSSLTSEAVQTQLIVMHTQNSMMYLLSIRKWIGNPCIVMMNIPLSRTKT